MHLLHRYPWWRVLERWDTQESSSQGCILCHCKFTDWPSWYALCYTLEIRNHNYHDLFLSSGGFVSLLGAGCRKSESSGPLFVDGKEREPLELLKAWCHYCPGAARKLVVWGGAWRKRMVPQILCQDHSWEWSKARRVSTSMYFHEAWMLASSPHKLGFEFQRGIPNMEKIALHVCICFRIFCFSHFKFAKFPKYLISRSVFFLP